MFVNKIRPLGIAACKVFQIDSTKQSRLKFRSKTKVFMPWYHRIEIVRLFFKFKAYLET
jgi:hypothetical protein